MHDDRTHVDLFSGIGGFSLAAESCGLRTVVFVERDPARQRDLGHHWPGVPIIADVNDVDAIERAAWRTRENPSWGSPRTPFLLTAGVPCQPASAAGKRQGSGDDRWLWPQTLRVVARLRPRWCVFENPLGLASLALPAALPDVDLERLRGVPGRTVAEIIRGLDLLGYDLPRDRDGVAWIPCVPAVGVGAFHGRDRLWLIAQRRDVGHAEGGRVEGLRANGQQESRSHAREGLSMRPSPEPCGAVADAFDFGSQERWFGHTTKVAGCNQTEQAARRIGSTAEKPNRICPLPDWTGAELERGADGITRPVKPGLCLLAHGLPGRVAKLRGLGNAIVPQVAAQILAALCDTDLN